MLRREVFETFRDFSRSTKWAISAMLLLGVAVLAFGVTADLCEAPWLKRYTYLPNIAAGFTGFLIGVPFALVVFSTLAGQREDKAASDRVQELSRIAWNQFRDAVFDLCGEQRMDAMESIAKAVKGYHDQTLKGFQNHESNAEKTSEDYGYLQDFIKQQIKAWQEPFAQMMRAVGTSQDLGMSWYALLRDWNTLDQYVRLQRLERGLPWFCRSLDSILQQKMNGAHPMQPFFDKHEGPKPEYDWRVDSMWSAFNSLYHYLDLTEGEFLRRKLLTSKHFPSVPVKGYTEAVEETAKNMRQLLYVVEEIDRSDWLASLPI